MIHIATIPDSYIQLLCVHGNAPKVDQETAKAVARRLSPDRQVLATYITQSLCEHRFRIWAAVLSGTDPRVAYIPGISGPHLPFVTYNKEAP